MTSPDDELTDEQEQIVGHTESTYVCACPGSGKTRTIVARAIEEARKLSSRRGLAFLSFTQAAAETYRERVADRGCTQLLRPPNFAGTFDSFIYRYLVVPGGHPSAPDVPIRFRDTWEGFNVGISLRTPQGAAQTRDVPLSAFRLEGQSLHLDVKRIKDYSIRQLAENLTDHMLAQAEKDAKKCYLRLLRKGFLTPQEGRRIAARRLEEQPEIKVLLSCRFPLLIVDEAQDCNDQGLDIIRTLSQAGSICTVVADPEQCIYGWRGAEPGALGSLDWPTLTLTGNFRSSNNICRAASALRPRPTRDTAVLDAKRHQGPIHVFSLAQSIKPAYGKLGEAFVDYVMQAGGDPREAVVLSYERGDARRAVGLPGSNSAEGTSKAARLVHLFRTLRGSEDIDRKATRELDELLQSLLLKRLCMNVEDVGDEPVWFQSWLKRRARMLVFEFEGLDMRELEWISMAQFILDEIRPPPGYSFKASGKQALVRRSVTLPKKAPSPSRLRHSTIHGAKGREYDSVLVVLNDKGRTQSMLKDCEQRLVESEARRTLYVAATRARNRLCFGAVEGVAERVVTLLSRDDADVCLVKI